MSTGFGGVESGQIRIGDTVAVDRPRGDLVEFAVRDAQRQAGHGRSSDEVQVRLFAPFFTTIDRGNAAGRY
jgi:hypothetical protein